MDPLDEFEFKPLTEGLGFHKKTIRLQEQVQRSRMVENSLGVSLPPSAPPEHKSMPTPAQSLEDLLKTLDRPMGSSVKITQTLPRPDNQSRSEHRKEALEIEMPPMGPVQVPRPQKGRLDIPTPGSEVLIRPAPLTPAQQVGPKRGASNSPGPQLEPATVSLQAAILDAVVVTAVTLLFLVSLVLITKIEIFSVFASAKTDITTQLSLILLFLAVMQMYVVVARSFYGRTLGEWTFDYQLGRDEEHSRTMYPILVTLRSLLIILTGLITLPVLSWMTGKDLAGRVTGVALFQQRMPPLG
jgi:hypothetical protein